MLNGTNVIQGPLIKWIEVPCIDGVWNGKTLGTTEPFDLVNTVEWKRDYGTFDAPRWITTTYMPRIVDGRPCYIAQN